MASNQEDTDARVVETILKRGTAVMTPSRIAEHNPELDEDAVREQLDDLNEEGIVDRFDSDDELWYIVAPQNRE